MVAVLTLRTETSGICPSSSHGDDSIRRRVSSDVDQGAFLGREISEREEQQFSLRWTDGTANERHLLLDAWDRTFSGIFTMTYTPIGDIDANALEVSFVPDSLSIVQNRLHLFTMSVKLEVER